MASFSTSTASVKFIVMEVVEIQFSIEKEVDWLSRV